MKIKENRPLIIIIVTLVIILLLSLKFYHFQNESVTQNAELTNSEDQIEQQMMADDSQNTSKEMTTYDLQNESEKDRKLQQLTQVDKKKLFENFKSAIEQMNSCLDFKVAAPEEQTDITTELLNSLIKSEVGEVIMRNEEVSETFLKKSEGEKFKIKLVMDYSGQNAITRRLEYSVMNAKGEWELQELTQEQREDPTDTMINSFLNDGEIYHEQKKSKYYFQNGEDLMAQMTDGLLTDFELFHINKKIHCSNMDTANMKCLCD